MSALRDLYDKASTVHPFELENDNGSWALAPKGYSPIIVCDSKEDAEFIEATYDEMPYLLAVVEAAEAWADEPVSAATEGDVALVVAVNRLAKHRGEK